MCEDSVRMVDYDTPTKILRGHDSCVHTAFPENFVATA